MNLKSRVRLPCTGGSTLPIGRSGEDPLPQRRAEIYTGGDEHYRAAHVNERENLPHALNRIREVADGRGVQLHTLIVDDDSPDGTAGWPISWPESYPDVSVLHRSEKEGLGKAYIAGFRHAIEQGAELLFEMDADLRTTPPYLPDFLRLIEQGADVVLGSRYVTGGGVENWPLVRKVISRGGSLYSRTILGLPYHDLTGGYKCFRRQVLEALDLDAIGASGYGFQIEMTYRAHKAGFTIKELPIIFVDRQVGRSKMSKGIFSRRCSWSGGCGSGRPAKPAGRCSGSRCRRAWSGTTS